MGAAYSPGLEVREDALVRRERRLPLDGEVVVSTGDRVDSRTVVARTELPGKVFAVNASGRLNVLEADLPAFMTVEEGAAVTRGALLAEKRGLFGLLRTRVEAPVDGVVESISARTGRVMVRAAPTPVEVHAYIDGEVREVHPRTGCTVEAVAAICQGIFGLGGEVEGPLVVAADPDRPLRPEDFGPEARGAVVVGGSLLSQAAYEAAAASGAVAVVTGGLDYGDIERLVGHPIGVAITGTEPLPTTVVLTEGFGEIAMARRTYELLSRLAGEKASVNGATQIRAGVIRPEVLVPRRHAGTAGKAVAPPTLALGRTVRIIRAPWFGALGKVVALPPELVAMESETQVRVLEAELVDGRRVVVPRANVEIVEGGE